MSDPEDLAHYPQVRVVGGPQDGKFLALGGATGERRLGSGRGCHLRLDGASIEDLHARLRWDERGIFLHDTGTLTGTFVNGERLEAAWDLADGDRISLGPPGSTGSAKLIAQLPQHPAAFPTPPEPAIEELEAEILVEAMPAAEAEPELLVEATPEPPPVAAPETTPKPRVASIPGSPRASFGGEPSATSGPKPHKLEAGDILEQPSIGAENQLATPRPRTAARTKPGPGRAAVAALGAAVLGAGGLYAYQKASKPPPVLLSLLPPKAEPGQAVMINGSSFDADPAANNVFFDDKKADVISASETQLTVTVPEGLSAENEKLHKVRVDARGRHSNAIFFKIYLAPRVTAFEPDVAMPGDEVRAAGENFDETTVVLIGGQPAPMLETGATSLRFRVPDVPLPQGKIAAVQVQVGPNSARLASLIIGRLPLLMEVTPPRGLAGDRVTLKGRGFDPAPGGTTVSFGGRAALVISAAPKELVVVAPAAAGLSGPLDVPLAVRAHGATSSSVLTFTLARVSSAVFTPRFFAEPSSGEDPERVLVSSELGPLLQLSGKAGAPSAAERAARVASALNAAMDAATRQAVVVESREKPEPAVALSESPNALVTVTSGDALAYQGPPSPRALAQFWAALVQDYLALFGQKQRPYRSLELNPKGRALLDLFADAERRYGQGSGVTPGLIEGLTQPQRRALQELAFAVPVDSRTTAGAAVAGRWEGNLELSGQGNRRIQLRLHTTGSGLEGQFTTSWGGVSVDLPLQGVRYDRGALVFTVTLGGSRHRFSGKVDGRSIGGSVAGPEDKPLGRFTLGWTS